MNAFDQINQAVREARELNDTVDRQANALCDLLDGRLKKLTTYRLKRLKRELQNFNANTGQWK